MKRTISFLVLTLIQLISNSSFAQVSQDWAVRYTSDSIRNESVSDMFVDAQGNVYVTGSQKSGFSLFPKVVTIKYNSSGQQQWIQNYVATANNGAFGRSIYVDGTGNVYITGESAISSGGNNDALII